MGSVSLLALMCFQGTGSVQNQGQSHIRVRVEMATQKLQAIAGVSASDETEIRLKYPSIASTSLGRVIGKLSNCTPMRIWGIRPSSLIFPLPLAPLGVALYAWLKLTGPKYVLTNRSVQQCTSLGSQTQQSVDLMDIDEIDLHQEPGQEFYNAANLTLIDRQGDRLMRIEGVPCADMFCASILKARDARLETADALATIQARA